LVPYCVVRDVYCAVLADAPPPTGKQVSNNRGQASRKRTGRRQEGHKPPALEGAKRGNQHYFLLEGGRYVHIIAELSKENPGI